MPTRNVTPAEREAMQSDDIVFNKVHVYLAGATAVADHERWHESIFDSLRKTAADTAAFKTAMREKYPDYSGERILRASAAVVYGLFTLPY